MEEDYKNNPIYLQGVEDGYQKAIANFAEIKVLDERLKAQGLCICDRNGNVLLGTISHN